MKRFISISSLFFMLISFDTAAQKHYNFKLSRVNYFEDSTRVGISFKIKNAKDFDRFDLDVSAFDEKQNSLSVNSLSNHLALEKDKFHTVYWNAINDGYILDGRYNLKLNLSRASTIKIPYNKHFILSALFPGLGDYKIRNGWWHGLYGILAYGATYYAIDYNEKANRNYILYRNSYNVEQSNNFFESARKQANLSRILAVTAGVTWGADLGLILNRIKRVKGDMSKSKFYQKKQDRIYQWGRDKYYYLNTKKKYERFYDSAIVSFDKQDYIQSRIYFDQAKSSNKSDTQMLKLINAYSDTVNLEIDYASYYRSGKLYLDKLELTKAKVSFNKANKLKPKQDSVVRKIDSITSYQLAFKAGDSLYAENKFNEALDYYISAQRIYPTYQVKIEIQNTNNEITFLNHYNAGDRFFKNKSYENAKKEYENARKIYPNHIELNQKLKDVEEIIDKINKNNKEYDRLTRLGSQNAQNGDFDNALVNYSKALTLRPGDSYITTKINQIKKYKEWIKKGDASKSRNIFNVALDQYKEAQKLYNSYEVQRKIDETEGEIIWGTLVNEGDKLKSNADKLKSNESFEDATTKYELALEKFEEANAIRSSISLKNKIQKVKDKIIECEDSLKQGLTLIDEKYIEIFNNDNLKVEIKFSFGNCSMKANMYTYRYDGKLSTSKKYVNWKVDYIDCNGSKKTFGRGIPIGGYDIISEIGGRPEDIETDGFDDQFQGKIIDKIYDVKSSIKEEKMN